MIRLTDASPPDIERWWDLYGRAVEPHPNTTPAWILGAASTPHERDGLLLCVLENGERWDALLLAAAGTAVVARRSRPALSNDDGLLGDATTHRHPLLSGDDPAGALAALLRGLPRHVTLPVMRLAMMPLDGPSGDALVAGVRRSRRTAIIDHTVDRRFLDQQDVTVSNAPVATADYVRALAGLGASTGHSLRRHAKRLDRHGSAPLAVSDDTDRPGALDEFDELLNSGWKGDSGRGGASPRVRGVEAGWRESIEAFQARGVLRLLSMRLDGRPAYMSLGVQAGATVFGFADAYDEDLAQHRVGTLGRVVTAVEWLRRDDVTRYDPCMWPVNEEANRIYASSRPFGTVTCALRPGGAALLTLTKVKRRADS